MIQMLPRVWLMPHRISPCSLITLQTRRSLISRSCSQKSTSPSPEQKFTVFRDVPQLRAVRRQMFRDGKDVGFVPTMGALHQGHLSLVRHALKENTDVFVSIFVNPTQFGVNEDLDAYPKTWDADMEKLNQVQQEAINEGASCGRIAGIFAPGVKVMYPTIPPSSEIHGEGAFVTITPLGKWLEGATRPVFFRGVATVCTKLFNVVQPDRVYFGQKDAQQSVLIKRMVREFHIPTQVRVISTTREEDGLAMSSRNVLLGARRRKEVSVLSRALLTAQQLFNDGEHLAGKIKQTAFKIFDRDLEKRGSQYFGSQRIEIVYIALTRPDDMTNIEDHQSIDPQQGAILSAAINVYPVDMPENEEERHQIRVRLIDNVVLEPRQYSIDLP